MCNKRDDLLLLQQIEELALSGEIAKKQTMFARLTASIGFLTPALTLALVAAGSIALPGIGSLSIMAVFALMTSKNVWDKGKNAIYKAFFDPHHKLVMEFERAVKSITSSSIRLTILYKKHNRQMFGELKKVKEQSTEKEALVIYKSIYAKHMSELVKAVNTAKLPLSNMQLDRFTKLTKSLTRVHLLNKV